MSNDSYCYLLSNVTDVYSVFKESIKFTLDYEKNIVVSIWGNIPNDILAELRIFKESKRSLRSVISKEYNYRITSSDLSKFLSFTDRIDIDKVSWGLMLGDVGVVLAKGKDEISMCSCDAISADAFVNLLDRLKNSAFIENFEVVKDDSGDE